MVCTIQQLAIHRMQSVVNDYSVDRFLFEIKLTNLCQI